LRAASQGKDDGGTGVKRAAILLLVLVMEFSLFTAISGIEFNSASELTVYLKSYISDLLVHAAPVLLLAFGMTIILMTAGIDLSVASMAALVGCVMSSFPGNTSFWWQALPAGLAVGIGAGALNGLLVARLDVPPIIATLGTMIFYRGLCSVVMGDLEKAPFISVAGYDWIGNLAGTTFLIVIVFLCGGLYFSNSVWRREILMIGGNRVAARYAGIRVERRLMQAYLMMGLLAFLAALSFTSRDSSVKSSSLDGMELHVIVAVVLGGTRVQGGGGSIIGTIFGVLFIAIMDEGLRGAAIWGGKNLPFRMSHLEYVLLGTLLVFGVWLNNVLQARAVREKQNG
jgi:ribose/xylose/arabinose/galactoside ABC-type transport system permease subunit